MSPDVDAFRYPRHVIVVVIIGRDDTANEKEWEECTELVVTTRIF